VFGLEVVVSSLVNPVREVLTALSTALALFPSRFA